MSWYRLGKQCFALRKHVMRVDMRLYAGEGEFNNANDLSSTIKSMLTAAIVKGLDVVGIVSTKGPEIGFQAMQLAKTNQIDLWVIPGQDYITSDKFHIIVYNLRKSLAPNLTLEQAVSQTHQQRGFVLAVELTKRNAQILNSAAESKNPNSIPDGVEIYNGTSGGYYDNHTSQKYHIFMSSAAKSAKDLESTNVFTLLPRKDLEEMNLLPQGEGEEYTPRYLQREDQINRGVNPNEIAEDKADAIPQSQGI